jgi:iron complex outermembrane recepter protein
MNYYGITPADPGYATALPPLVTMSNNEVPAYSVFNLTGAYDFKIGGSTTLQLFAAVDNVFDKNPPIAAGSGFGGNANGGTNPVFFDALGRAFRIGLRATF